ncbi:hypothetical protein ABUV78_00692 [Clavibacter nebraskensis]
MKDTVPSSPANGTSPVAVSRIVSVSAMGTSAAVVPPSRLERMSLRTMPERSRTSGPLDPSPGYGPAVSSGISPVRAAALSVPPDPAAPAGQAARATDPMPAPR